MSDQYLRRTTSTSDSNYLAAICYMFGVLLGALVLVIIMSRRPCTENLDEDEVNASDENGKIENPEQRVKIMEWTTNEQSKTSPNEDEGKTLKNQSHEGGEISPIDNHESDDTRELPSLARKQSSISTSYLDSDDCCAICLSRFHASQLVCQSLNSQCQHTFHWECLRQWIIRGEDGSIVEDQNHAKCPICRQDFI